MEIKRDILWRVYVCYIIIVAICIAIFSKAFYIQQVQGDFWRSMSDSLHEKIEELDAERGTIYTEDGEMLSTSIPQFDIYVDFAANGLRENQGRLFHQNLDSLSYCLADLFKDRSPTEYKKLLNDGYRKGVRYFPLKKKVSFRDYREFRQFPLVRLGKNKSGFIADIKSVRLNPYKLLAYRTIGLDRENSQKVGLEQTYDSLLKGTTGKRLVRYIGGGVAVPMDEDNYQIEPEDGKDIITTIDIHIQEIAENALMKMMQENEAEQGCAIVMEVHTGKIKALANLGRGADGNYWEDFNYAMTPTEPGSTFKLVTLLSVLEDKKFSLSSPVNLGGGTWQINGQTVYDSEKHGVYESTVKRAFELSSNVGLAKLAYNSYAATPSQFVNHLKKLGLDVPTGIDLYGERSPVIYKPGSRYWSATTLPWMAFGYNLAITPLHTCMLYNAIANNGTMMKPYLLSVVKKDGNIRREIHPAASAQKICGEETLRDVKECLIGVCSDSGSTGYRLFKGSPYKVAGKTGTALVANGSKGYSDHIYQSSFAGFFPADDPQYSCVVVIKNKPNAVKFYGASVAGPVFKEIADRLYVTHVKHDNLVSYAAAPGKDSSWYSYTGRKNDMEKMMKFLNIRYVDSTNASSEWTKMYRQHSGPVLSKIAVSDKSMPLLAGMGLKDALFISENLGIKLNIKGKGKVSMQSIAAGQPITKGQAVDIVLN